MQHLALIEISISMLAAINYCMELLSTSSLPIGSGIQI